LTGFILLAVVTIGSHMSDFEQSEEYALCFDEFLRRAISALDPHESIDRITLCQAKLLACINQIYSGEEIWQESAYNEFLTDLISFCQLEWKMSETGFTTFAPEGQEAEFWKRWVQLESCRRTGYAIWMLDTMWAYQFQVQPRLTLEDGRIPLPCQEVLWESKTALQWHHIFQFSPSNLTLLSSLQSLQNEKILQNTMGEFSRIILLHGFYHQCWELEKAEIQSQPRPQQMSMYTFWSNSTMESLELLQWSANSMVASGMEHPTLLHLHLARIVLFAPFQSICDLAYGMTKEDSNMSPAQMTALRKAIREWVTEDASKARLVTLHAGALLRHVHAFHTNSFYEPSAVLLATLTLWTFGSFATTARNAGTCSQRRYSDTQIRPISIAIDQPLDPELARSFVNNGGEMQPTLRGVGSICGVGAPERVLLEGSKLVSEIGRWGSGPYSRLDVLGIRDSVLPSLEGQPCQYRRRCRHGREAVRCRTASFCTHSSDSSRRQRVNMNYTNLTVIGLREELAKRGLSASAIKLKKDLIARLQQDDKDKADASSAAIRPEANPQSSITLKAEADIDVPSAKAKTEALHVPPVEPSEYGSDDLFDELDADALISASQQSPSALLKPESSFAVPPTPTLKRPLPEEDDFSGDEIFNDPGIEEIWTSSQQERRAPEAPIDKPEHVALIRRLLREKFGYPGFRGEQEKAILSLLRGENTLAIFPTGAGKSLCYQIPAIAFPLMDKMSGNERPHGAGLTLVVSPLIALMKDQTDALKKRGIAADCSDSTKTYEQHQQIHADIHAGKLRLLYVSPEKLSNEAFVASMKHVAGGVRLVAVDEAHCISEWGHSFRPTYLMVERFTKEIKAERVICLTATATPEVAEDVRAAFDILERNEFRTSPYRPNLRLEAVATDSQEAKLPLLFKWLREHPGSTIVYVTLQQQAEDLCKVLRSKSFNAAFYHAGMKVEEKTAVQDNFMADKIRIVVATIAFGMGIDKSDIRGVVHLDLASTVEEYSQQIGRAGRDGEPGYCIMFICHSDIYLRQNFSLGDLPSRKSLLGLLKDVFGRERTRDTEGEVIRLAHRELSTLYDIRLSPLGVVFAALELRFGLLRAITPEYTSYQFEDKGRYHAVASSDHSPEARAIYSMSTKAIKNFTFDMNAATRRGLMRANLVQKLDSWNATGVIMLKTSGVMNRYRVLSPLPTAEADIQALADDLFADMAQREKDALGRIDQMVGLITGKSCLALGLAEHFGMDLPDCRRSCGHCTYCAWGEAATLAPKPAPPLNVEGVKRVLAACPHDDPRLLARVAFGIKSPRITQLKLDKSSVFESLADHEFSTLLREFEAACRTAAHGPLDAAQAQLAVAGVAEEAATVAEEAMATGEEEAAVAEVATAEVVTSEVVERTDPIVERRIQKVEV
ncbi:ATP-dependent DNA helicase, partial [Aureobasidium melanogenum]